MEVWLLVVVSVSIAALLKALINVVTSSSTTPPPNLPQTASSIFPPLIYGFLWLRKSSLEMEATLRSLRAKLGPILTIQFPSRSAIFIFSHSIAHKALVQNGAVFADRPKPLLTENIITCNSHNINSCGYGEKWRILGRNLTSHILHPSKTKSFSATRSWALGILIQRLRGSESLVDITGSREIKMMPFGVGRRICPGLNLALLHLHYFVANLVWEFEWIQTEEFPVDFAEKQQFTIVMKHPLRAKVRSRR